MHKYDYCIIDKQVQAFKIVTGIRCEDPGEPINGGTTVSSFSVGSTAIHFCNEGFILDGVSQRTCLENGTFSDSLPTCVSKWRTVQNEHH